MEELPHDKVSARMHEQRMVPQRPPLAIPGVVPFVSNDSNEPTVLDDKMLAKPLTIESKKPARIGDDDPTMLQVRVDELRKGGGAERDRPSGKARALDGGQTRPDPTGARRLEDAAPTHNDEHHVDTSTIRKSSGAFQGSKLSLILALVIVALVVAAAGLYLFGVIRI
jgi:hypothetical protein